MLSDEFRSVFIEILKDEILNDFVSEFDLKKRERKIDVLLFIRSMIGAAAAGHGGRQAAVLRFYIGAVAHCNKKMAFESA
jgi:hypothetical protein